MIKFKTTKREEETVQLILNRTKLLKKHSHIRLNLHMDLVAVHSNGNPLDFLKLLSFDDFNFMHDIFGISRFIDRNTGKLLHYFIPRCSKRTKKRRNQND